MDNVILGRKRYTHVGIAAAFLFTSLATALIWVVTIAAERAWTPAWGFRTSTHSPIRGLLRLASSSTSGCLSLIARTR